MSRLFLPRNIEDGNGRLGRSPDSPGGVRWCPCPHGGFVFLFSDDPAQADERDRYFDIDAEQVRLITLALYDALMMRRARHLVATAPQYCRNDIDAEQAIRRALLCPPR